MSKVFQQSLCEFLVRKKKEGRLLAKEALIRWQEALKSVKKAQQMADTGIHLPEEVAKKGLEQQADRYKTANYIVAMDIVRGASFAHNKVIELTVLALKDEMEVRRSQVKGMENKLAHAVRARDCQIDSEKAIRDEKNQKINKEADLPLKLKPLGLWICIPVGLAIHFLLACIALSVHKNQKNAEIPDEVRRNPSFADIIQHIVIPLYLPFWGWCVTPLLFVGLWILGWCALRLSMQLLKIPRLDATYASFEATCDRIKSDFRQTEIVSQNQMKIAQEVLYKAESALRWFQGEFAANS